ncbi:protein kinase [Candidatus Woesearchaeota archaeon]|nr:protein kinase [Candidatus Woesearchaeota archaeon]
MSETETNESDTFREETPVLEGSIAELQEKGIYVDAGMITPVAQREASEGPRCIPQAVLSGLEEAILSEIKTGNYTVRQEIHGGQGEVTRLISSDQSAVNFDVAAKAVSLQKMDDWSQVDRLEREAAITRGLEIEGLVRYFAFEIRKNPKRFGEGVDTEYILYSHWLGTGNLAERFAEKNYDFSSVKKFLEKALSMVGKLHINNVLHRDPNPRNFVELEDGDFGIIDFGLSKKEGQTTVLYSAGSFIGTPAYAAPEVQDGKKPSKAADVYSTCATAVSMLLGTEFSHFTTPADIKDKLAKIYFPKEYDGLKAVIAAGLETNPERRMEKFELVDDKGYVFREENIVREMMVDSQNTRKEHDRKYAGLGSFLQQKWQMVHGWTQMGLTAAAICGLFWIASFGFNYVNNTKTDYTQEGTRTMSVPYELLGRRTLKHYSSEKLEMHETSSNPFSARKRVYVDNAPADGILDSGEEIDPLILGGVSVSLIKDSEILAEAQEEYDLLREKFKITIPPGKPVERVARPSLLDKYIGPAVRGQN